MYVYASYVFLVPTKAKEVAKSPEIGVTSVCEPPCGLNTGTESRSYAGTSRALFKNLSFYSFYIPTRVVVPAPAFPLLHLPSTPPKG